ncbi:MAG TPA: glucose 1-dehydrogenase [Candidatus Latescibacteria bacterium]|nr:glucose 1-dehydrogenase [Candidatus Latescibacterota bacterium]
MTDRFSLDGKIAVVTGGSRGIGKGIAVGFAEHGADVAIVYRSAQKEAEAVAERIRGLGRRCWVFRRDLGEVETLSDFVDDIWRTTGRIDVLVNNAGMAYLERFNEITAAHWRRLMAVNLDAVFFMAQRTAEHMIRDGIKGRIINLSSKNGLVAEAGLAHYNASKGGVELVTKSLAIELGEHGITVNCIAPGIIETEIAGEFDIDPAFFSYYKEHIPLEHRFGAVEECVGAAVFLASSAGSYITGQSLVIDGGVLCEQVPRMQFMSTFKNTLNGG